jgi:uncharacterized protein
MAALYFIAPYLQVVDMPNKGRGIISLDAIPANTTIEISPVIVMDADARKLLDKTTLHDYIFIWGDNEDECCMAQGYISLYNHSNASNAEYFMDFEDKLISIKTVRDIAPLEEVCINYNGDWDNKGKVWFLVKNE